MNDSWSSGNPYERFMGRWSSLIVTEFLAWLDISPEQNWLDVGCGTGSLTRQILADHQPKKVMAVDASEQFISHAKQSISDSRAEFKVTLAQSLDLDGKQFDTSVSGLVLNFVPEPEAAVAEMIRVTKPDGTIGIFLWDYEDGMKMLRYFWDAAVELDPQAKQFDEGLRFPLCQKGELEAVAKSAGLQNIEAKAIEVQTVFQNFDDYWQPFLGQVGPASSYTTSLNRSDQIKLENSLRERLPTGSDGSISIMARAWAIKGIA